MASILPLSSCRTLHKEEKTGITDNIYFPAFPMLEYDETEIIYNDDGTIRGVMISASYIKKLSLFSVEYEDALTLLIN